jgi:hypothetical protein
MTVDRTHYEELLAEFSNAVAAIALLKQHRPYLEMLPSMRRPQESLISIPLPVVKLRRLSAATGIGVGGATTEVLRLPCDLGMLMCDPEWKIKTGVEIFVFIHRPQEDFSDLLGRWRQTQVILSQGYEWEMPSRYAHILSEGADNIYPLFVLFAGTPERIKRGLQGAYLPFVERSFDTSLEDQTILPIDEMVLTDNWEDTGL